jgi:hypothetical protein
MKNLRFPTDIISRALLLTATALLLVVVIEVAEIVTGPAAVELIVDDESVLFRGISADPSGSISHPPLGDFSEILRRPFYEWERRPVQANQTTNDNASADRLKQKWRLSGIIISENNIAILETQRAGEALSLVEGQSLEGWRVQEIGANDVLLNRGGESVRLALHDETANGQVNGRNKRAQTWKPSTE